MLQTIIKKLEAETENNINDRTFRVIAEFITDLCDKSTEVADAVYKSLEAGKSIAGAIDAMRKTVEEEAKKNQHNNVGCACLSPDEGFAIIREYFGIGSGENLAKGNDEKVVSILDFV